MKIIGGLTLATIIGSAVAGRILDMFAEIQTALNNAL